MALVFVSYRRQDSADIVGRISDRLIGRFGKEEVFVDVDNIPPGDDFVRVLERAVAECQVFIAILGPNWITAADSDGRRRLDDPADYVRLEVAAALTRNIPVVPVLVGGATMPSQGSLPESLVPLLRRNALEIRNIDFHQHMDVLIEAVERHSRGEDVGHELVPDEPFGAASPYVARIEHLDAILHHLLVHELPPHIADYMSITFETPNTDFPPASVPLPAVDLFLYDFEQHGLASARRPSALPVTYLYLVTAWASEVSISRARDEHRMLSEVMNIFTRYSTIPDSLVQAALTELRVPEGRLPTISVRPNRFQNVSEFWQALGGVPKPALNYSITVTP